MDYLVISFVANDLQINTLCELEVGIPIKNYFYIPSKKI